MHLPLHTSKRCYARLNTQAKRWRFFSEEVVLHSQFPVCLINVTHCAAYVNDNCFVHTTRTGCVPSRSRAPRSHAYVVARPRFPRQFCGCEDSLIAFTFSTIASPLASLNLDATARLARSGVFASSTTRLRFPPLVSTYTANFGKFLLLFQFDLN